MIDLDPAKRVWRSEVDDFDDRFVTGGIALERDLVAGSLAHSVVRRRFDRHAARQPLRHAHGIGNEGEHLVDWRRYTGGVGERDRSHGAGNIIARLMGRGDPLHVTPQTEHPPPYRLSPRLCWGILRELP